MSTAWVVVLVEHERAYGPFGEKGEAAAFAAFLCVEVDPAIVVELFSSTLELLAWRDTVAMPALTPGDPS